MATRFYSLDDPELIAMINKGNIGVIPSDTGGQIIIYRQGAVIVK